jgi:hypothetical protein
MLSVLTCFDVIVFPGRKEFETFFPGGAHKSWRVNVVGGGQRNRDAQAAVSHHPTAPVSFRTNLVV